MGFVGGRLREVRESYRMSQGEFAEILGVKLRTVSDYERGASLIDVFHLLALSRRVGLPMEYFVDPEFKARVLSAPHTRGDWKLMYPEEPERARLHFEMDKAFEERVPSIGTI